MIKRYSLYPVILFILIFTYSNRSICQENIVSLPSLREQAKIQQEWVKIRMEKVLPKLMRENNIQMWIIIAREHNEDPVFTSLVSPTTLYVRRRTMFVFYDAGINKGVERYSVGSSDQYGLYSYYIDTASVGDREKKQWLSLKKLIIDKNPKTISVNISHTFEFSDGLLAGEWEFLKEYLGAELVQKIKPAGRLPLDYISTRIPEMIPYYKILSRISRRIAMDAFSNKVIKPGITTATDVVWWMREEALKAGFQCWFQPSVNIQRNKAPKEDKSEIIKPGDVLHCDFGIKGMNLNTDMQYMAYVLKENESDVPEGIKHALANSNRLQDIQIENMKTGLSGNQVLKNSLNRMKSENIKGAIYSHPIGEHGHGAGAIIGLWDKQEEVPGRGDVPLLPNTWYSIELQATTKIPEWNNQELVCGQEEDAMINNEGKVEWVLDRQTKFLIIK